MDLMITEVQITFVILMTLISILLAFVIPHYASAGKVYDHARKLLLAGSILVAIHFLVQYYIEKHGLATDNLRIIINLLFGFPCSFLVNLSLITLQKRGKVRIKDWSCVPILYLISIFTLLYLTFDSLIPKGIEVATYAMAFLYAASLVYFTVLELQGYIRIERSIRHNNNKSYIPLVKWTKWSTYLLAAVSLGFPIMIFIPDPFYRSLYGILSIAVCFFYIIGFMCYGLSSKSSFLKSNFMDKQQGENLDIKPKWSEDKNRFVEAAIARFIGEETFLQPKITIKKAAEEMGISSNMLKTWVQNTPYQKFSRWILHLRIEKAKQYLLEYPKISSGELAEKCGFCDRQYFQRLFHQEEGKSPSQWLSEQKAKHIENEKE